MLTTIITNVNTSIITCSGTVSMKISLIIIYIKCFYSIMNLSSFSFLNNEFIIIFLLAPRIAALLTIWHPKQQHYWLYGTPCCSTIVYMAPQTAALLTIWQPVQLHYWLYLAPRTAAPCILVTNECALTNPLAVGTSHIWCTTSRCIRPITISYLYKWYRYQYCQQNVLICRWYQTLPQS